MRRLLILLISTLCFSEMNWELEIVDSEYYATGNLDFAWCDIALDTSGIPHITYYKDAHLVHASRYNTGWEKEVVESGLLYTCFSFIFDDNNIGHLSYYRTDTISNMTYLCYAKFENNNWVTNVADSFYGVLTPYWFFWGYFKTSLDLDTFNLPGIAYTSWNHPDSVFYIKYAHFDGISWNVSVVEYDSFWTNTVPSDWSPSLKFDQNGVPWITFYHCPFTTGGDTIKLAYYNDTINTWFKIPVICEPETFVSVSLAFDSLNHPCIAHGITCDLFYSWWNGTTWISEDIIDISLYHAEVDLKLDNYNNPHIAFFGDFFTPSPDYCYKDSIWHIYMMFDSVGYAWRDISLDLDTNNNPHLSYYYCPGGVCGIRYAKCTFVGVEENDAGYRMYDTGLKMEILPSISYDVLNIEYDLKNWGGVSMEIYDITGARRKSIKLVNCHPGHHQKAMNLADLVSGVYFLVLKQGSEKVSKKFILMR
ncbi:MAG: T9SS type A sorting domain-containing protein [candidate division WOR-3 bacterium]